MKAMDLSGRLFFFFLFVSVFPVTQQELLHGEPHHVANRGRIMMREWRRLQNQQTRDQQYTGSCGLTEYPASRVVSGKDASLAEWPWQIWINITNIGFTCGGSLISPGWVLTAGHCIVDDDKSKYLVTIGDVDRDKHERSEQTFKVKRILKHSLYGYDVPYNNDVALLQLSRKARITPFVNTVCLPKSDEDVPVGTKCFISGWGQMLHPGSAAEVLQQAEMPVVSNSACAAKLDTSPNKGLHTTDGRDWAVTGEMICAGDAGRTKTNGCFGDSGGPFVCKGSNGRWVLQGVVSWGDPDCSSSNHYSVFARVSQFIPWIRQQMAKYSF